MMTETAAAVGDAYFSHSFTTPKYLRETVIPEIERVLKERGRSRESFRLVGMPFMATGETAEDLKNATEGVKKNLAFYASTPAYKSVLDIHGMGDRQPEMLRLSKLGRWQEMGALVDDTFLNTFAVVGDAKTCAQQLHERFDGIFDMIGGYSAEGPGMPAKVMLELKKIQGR
jgi:alkanesulfonate monooxygenase SsuD/methylene tetrahydromethanopterin reductase-like flavin-dependent oxidoreductase (luciferase family)